RYRRACRQQLLCLPSCSSAAVSYQPPVSPVYRVINPRVCSQQATVTGCWQSWPLPVINFFAKNVTDSTKASVEIFDKNKKSVRVYSTDSKDSKIEINQGMVHYVDKTSSPKVDVALKNLHVLATNLKNAEDSNTLLPSTVTASANAYEGQVKVNMKLNALAKAATFDLNADIKRVNLVLLNDFLKAYGNFDVTRGTFGLYSEFAAKNGEFKGYVKPIIKDLDVVGPDDRKDAFFNKVWETVVGGVGVIFKNQKKDQIATKVSIEGNFKDPTGDVKHSSSF
ncbi:MAG: DUF748 domain-containing protein, partial [Chitinophagaceae bacterium]